MSEYVPKVGHIVESIYTDDAYQPLKGIITGVHENSVWVHLSDNDHPEWHTIDEITYIPRHAYPYNAYYDDPTAPEYQFARPQHA